MRYQTELQKLTIGKIVLRILISLGFTVAFILIFAFTIMAIIIHGPSKSASDLFVTTCMETSFLKYFPPVFVSMDEIKEIQKRNSVIQTLEVTDTKTEFVENVVVKESEKDIEIVEIIGDTYKGKMMIVKDPSRVKVCCPDVLGKDASGDLLVNMMKKSNAVAGINAGGFLDEGGMSNGGVPLGIVVRDGKFIFGEGSGGSTVIGFDSKNVLHVGQMTAAQAKERNIRDAVSFGPALIINSKPMRTVGNGGGVNPRTAIGQRADGAVLLLAIDGRQPHSLGATFKDLVDIMAEYGAVNAGNLDGGSSSLMYYEGKLQNTCASVYGPRKIPNGFIVI